MMKRVAVILVNYQNSQLSVDCCRSILPQQSDKLKITIVIVDNDSKAEEKEILKRYEQTEANVHVVYSNENLGYFPGMKAGQMKAYELGVYDYMILSNNDIIYSDNFFGLLVSKAYPEHTMVVSPDIITVDGRHQNPHFVGRISSIRKMLYHVYFSHWYISRVINYIQLKLGASRLAQSKPGFETEGVIYMGFGACLILTKEYMDFIKFVDDRSFLMGEEQLLTMQVENAGGLIFYYPTLKLQHLDSATFKKMPSRFSYECMRKSYKLYKDYI